MSEGAMDLKDEVIEEMRQALRELITAAREASEASRALTDCIRGALPAKPLPCAPEPFTSVPSPEPRRLEVKVADLRYQGAVLLVDDDPTSWAVVGATGVITTENQPFRICPDPFNRLLTILGRVCPVCRGTGAGLLAAAGLGFTGGTCPRCKGDGDWREVPK